VGRGGEFRPQLGRAARAGGGADDRHPEREADRVGLIRLSLRLTR
jgi:hypothetical protein